MSITTDIATVRDHALLVWRGLSDAQKSAMRQAERRGGSLTTRGNARTLRSLWRHGITRWEVSPAELTVLGTLVREVGMEAEARTAQRRHSRSAC